MEERCCLRDLAQYKGGRHGIDRRIVGKLNIWRCAATGALTAIFYNLFGSRPHA
jgi:hypothetical protein